LAFPHEGNDMKLWQKLTIDWPCALGDWLWANFVVAPASFLDRLTLRSAARIVLQIALFATLLVFFRQIFPTDLTFLFTMDANVYLDIFVVVFVFVARGQLRQLLRGAAVKTSQSLQNGAKAPLRFAARQRRNLNAMRRKLGGRSKTSDDEPAAWGALGFAG
jgi:hypothetical protein